MLHIRFNDKSDDFTDQEAGVTAASTDKEIRCAAARLLDVDISRVEDLVVDRRGVDGKDIIVRPHAMYG